MLQKEGKYWVEAEDKPTKMLANLLHFSEEEAYILAKSIDGIEGHTIPAIRLKQKLVAFLNHDKAVEAYLKKEKPEMDLKPFSLLPKTTRLIRPEDTAIRLLKTTCLFAATANRRLFR